MNREIACCSSDVPVKADRERRAGREKLRGDAHEARKHTDEHRAVDRECRNDLDERDADRDIRRENHRDRREKHDEFYRALRTMSATDWLERITRLAICEKIVTKRSTNTTSLIENTRNGRRNSSKPTPACASRWTAVTRQGVAAGTGSRVSVCSAAPGRNGNGLPSAHSRYPAL